MKKRWILFLIPVMMVHAQWSDPITISEGYVPDFDIDPNGHLHIVSVLNGVIYTETDELGNKIVPSAVIPGTTSDTEYWNFGATVAADNNGFPHVCFRVPRGNYYYDVYYTRKTLSGWLNNPLLIASNKKRAYMVRMAIDSQNKAHIAVGYLDDESTVISGPIAYYRVRNNFVEHTIEDLDPLHTYWRSDNRLEMTIGSDDVIHLISGCPGIPNLTYEGPVTYFRSTDGGDTFEFVADIHNIKCTHRNAAPDVSVDDHGVVHMLYGAKIDMDRNSKQSLRYVRFYDDQIRIDNPITNVGEVKPWGYPEGYDPEHGKNYGLGSIAACNDGEIIMMAYVTNPSFYSGGVFFRGDLYAKISADSGKTWGARQPLAENVSDNEGRNVHLLRAYKNHFYVIYPHNEKPKRIKLRYLRNLGDNPPVAHAGGPYTTDEGAPLILDASGTTDSGQNPGIVLYEWDLNNNGEYEMNTEQPTFETQVFDDYYSTIRLRVTDHAGYTDEAETTILVNNVSPTVEIGPDTTIDEAQSLNFHCTVEDPGIVDTHTFAWDFGDGHTDNQQSGTHTYDNDGEYEVIATVTDNNNGVARDTLTVTVNNVPPVANANAGGPYQGPIHVPIEFTGSATDPSGEDMANLTYRWDMNNDSHFESPGQTVSYAFSQEGTFTVWLQVSDNADSDVDSAIVVISNDPPTLSDITDKTISEGDTFAFLPLDGYVSDPDQQDSELSWTVEGQSELLVSMTNRTLSVSAPHADWFGSEKLILTVSDPGGLTDTTHVRFSIIPVNDSPVWTTPIPDFVVDEDVALYIPLDSLNRWAADIDDPDDQLSFSLTIQDPVLWGNDAGNQRLWLQGEQDWNGQAAVIFTVTDTTGAADADTSVLTVRAVPDNPADFRLIEPMLLDSTDKIWPESIQFTWHATYDPDNPEGVIYYTWTMNNLDGFDIRTLTVFDTVTTFHPEGTLPDGRFLWHVTAYTSGGLSIRSENSGFIIVGKIDTGTSVHSEAMEIPESFQLMQNYPNPFNPSTRLTYHIPEMSQVELSIYNTMGQKTTTLVDEMKSPGVYTVTWHGINDKGQKCPTGIYICRMTAGTHLFLRKMMMIQ